MPPVSPIASSSTPLPWLLQSADAVQSNDLLYRGALDVTAWDIPVYMSARNKDEQRERFIEVSLNTICGFIWVPISTLILNHVVSRHLPQKIRCFSTCLGHTLMQVKNEAQWLI
ncbi:MAG: hypothetical protein HEQ32_06035 [Vampirovibrio sp.]